MGHKAKRTESEASRTRSGDEKDPFLSRPRPSLFFSSLCTPLGSLFTGYFVTTLVISSVRLFYAFYFFFRYAEAKRLGEQVNTSRQKISKLFLQHSDF